MGLIKAAASAIGSGLGDQWLEVLEANDMGGSTVFTSGVPVLIEVWEEEYCSPRK